MIILQKEESASTNSLTWKETSTDRHLNPLIYNSILL